MIAIIGKNPVSETLCAAAEAAGQVCTVVESVADLPAECDLAILNSASDLNGRLAEIAQLEAKTAAPIAVRLRMEYACSYTKDMADKTRLVGIRTMEDEFIGQYVELTRSFDTSDETYEKVLNLLTSFNAHVATVPDVRGGIYYRIMPLTINMGACLIAEGNSAEDVDKSMRFGANIKRPPLQTADELGLDVVLEVLTDIYNETGRPAYRPCPLLKQMVNAGRLGKKTGRGFFEYQ